MQAQAGGDRLYHHVRIERHDRPPAWPDDPQAFMETPYASQSGTVELNSMTIGGSGDRLDVGPAGLYRVRLAMWPGTGAEPDPDGSDGNRWLFQFWPAPLPVELPRWYRRR